MPPEKICTQSGSRSSRRGAGRWVSTRSGGTLLEADGVAEHRVLAFDGRHFARPLSA